MKLSKITAAALCFSALTSFATEQTNKDYYVQFNTGPAYGMSAGGEMGPKNMGTSPLFGIEAGYQVNENFRTSVSLDYLSKFSWTLNTYEADINTTSIDRYKVKSLSAMINAYYDIADFNGLTPYAMLGAGV
ncbi:MAG: outer membrane beta-barrel protein, partial [Pseudomonadota bacterium]